MMDLTFPVYITLRSPNVVEARHRLEGMLHSGQLLSVMGFKMSYSIGQPIPAGFTETKSAPSFSVRGASAADRAT
jgi:hypothetical protein